MRREFEKFWVGKYKTNSANEYYKGLLWLSTLFFKKSWQSSLLPELSPRTQSQLPTVIMGLLQEKCVVQGKFCLVSGVHGLRSWVNSRSKNMLARSSGGREERGIFQFPLDPFTTLFPFPPVKTFLASPPCCYLCPDHSFSQTSKTLITSTIYLHSNS